MQTLPDECVDITITSPPYDDLRTYEDKMDFDFDKFMKIAEELYRITKEGGVVVWVVGDAVVNGSETGTSFKQALYFKEVGFRLHDTMIYQKNNFSNPSNIRYHQIFEYMFVFSKGKPKTFNPIKDKKNKYAGQTSWGKNTVRQRDGTLVERPRKIIAEYGMRNNIWKYNVGKGFTTKDDIAYLHPAVFPEKLVEDHIKSWTNPGDLVFDPMAGSGTTLKMAILNGRDYLGFEINESYVNDIIKPRLKKVIKSVKSQ